MRKSSESFRRMKVDNLGRVTIPVDIRRRLDIDEFDFLEVSCDGECVRFQKEDSTELDKKIKGVLVAAKESYKLTGTDYEVLKEILGKLRS